VPDTGGSEADMMIAPMQINAEEYILIVALQDENLERIKQKDPAQLQIHRLAEPFNKLKLREVHLTYITEKELKIAQNMILNGEDVRGFLRKLCSGWKYRPDNGDNDLPPATLKPVN
jgi:hypothetical protein